jgi:membrane protein
MDFLKHFDIKRFNFKPLYNMIFCMFMFLQGQIILVMTVAKGNNIVGIPLLLLTSAITLAYAVRMGLLDFKRYRDKKVWLYGIVGVIATYIISVTANAVILNLTHKVATPDNQAALIKGVQANPIGFILYACLIAPIIEELYFRKTTPDLWYSTIRQINSKTKNPDEQEIAVPETGAISSLMAGIAYLGGTISFINSHNPGDMASWITYGVLAAVFLYIRVKKGIEASIITHILWNTLAMVMLFIPH